MIKIYNVPILQFFSLFCEHELLTHWDFSLRVKNRAPALHRHPFTINDY